MSFATGLQQNGLLENAQSVKAELYGSLGATGKGHGSDKAVLLGLEGEAPELLGRGRRGLLDSGGRVG